MKSNTFLGKKRQYFLMEAAPRFAAILSETIRYSLDKHLLTRDSEYFDLTLLCQDKGTFSFSNISISSQFEAIFHSTIKITNILALLDP